MEVDLRRLQRQAAEGADRHRRAAVAVARKVAVIGPTGSGKTTVARELARRLGVAHVELDSLFWNPGWVETRPEEFKRRVAAALAGHDAWVVDGNYRSRLGTVVLDQADLIVWLDLPLRVTFARLFWRTIRRLRTREVLWGTNVDNWRDAFLTRNSLFWWLLKTHIRWRRTLPGRLSGYTYVRLRSRREVERFLQTAE